MSESSRASSLILGVAGGSGSGKTYFAQAVFKHFGPEICSVIYQDNFYIDQSAKFDRDGGRVNFDHPDSLDFELMAEKLKQLRQGQNIDLPVYDFSTHTRQAKTLSQKPTPIVLVDGILILHARQVRSALDRSVFFDTPEKLRYERRLHRDVQERGRTPEGVLAQFQNQVKPMHDQFVEPSKIYAHWVMDEEHKYEEVQKQVIAYLHTFLTERR